MLLRDRLLARLNQMGRSPDYVLLAAEVLGIRNAPPMLAKRLVDQALVLEDRREEWLRRGQQICDAAPVGPGVYVLRDSDGRPLYVGKANNLRRRLRTHFAPRRWRNVKAEFARATQAEWLVVGSEVEALIREASLIRTLAPAVNVQVGTPQGDTRAVPEALRRDSVVVLPSAAEDAVELLATRVTGRVMLVRVRRDSKGLRTAATRVWHFFYADDRPGGQSGSVAPDVDNAYSDRTDAGTLRDVLVMDNCAPIVWSWLAGRGASATRLDPHDANVSEFERRIRVLLRDDDLFSKRIVVLRSGRRR